MTDLRRADVAHVIHPLTSHGAHSDNGPTIVVEADGAEIVLEDGTRLIDATSGLWCVNVGHGRKEIAAAVAAQMERVSFAHSFAGFASPPSIQLAERLADLLPGDLDAVMFSSGGAEANESAFKLARLVHRLAGAPERDIILSHDRGYHGLATGPGAATGLAQYHVDFPPVVPGYERFPSPYCYRSGDGHPDGGDCAAFHVKGFTDAVERLGAERVAAVIVEPVIGTGGVIVPPDGYMAGLREACDRFGILLISDEVITGFGRTGRWFGCERDGVVPDLLTFAKGVTSGYVPLSGVAAGRKVWDAVHAIPGDRPLMHGYTYAGHPVACAAALANIDIIENEGLVERAAQLAGPFAAALEPLNELPEVGEVRTHGLMAGIELVADKATKERYPASDKRAPRAVAEARKRGVSARPALDDIIVLSPPLITSEAQIERIGAAVHDAIVASQG